MYNTSDLFKDFKLHGVNEFSEGNNICNPFKCGITKLFWYIMKVCGILGVKEINIILKFLHSEHFKLEETPKSYSEVENFEPHIEKGNVTLRYITSYYR